MKKLIISLLSTLIITSLSISAVQATTVRVKGYIKKDGTYVAPHVRTSPDKTKLNNYSTEGNVNPYTGKEGTEDPYKAPAKPAKTKKIDIDPLSYVD